MTGDQIFSLTMALLSLLGSGGIGFTVVKTLVANEAKEALKKDIDALHTRINKVEDTFVSCKFCTMQHDNLNSNLADINKKLDIVINKL